MRPMPRLPDYIQYEYACHEGNYAMTCIFVVLALRNREQGTAPGQDIGICRA